MRQSPYDLVADAITREAHRPSIVLELFDDVAFAADDRLERHPKRFGDFVVEPQVAGVA